MNDDIDALRAALLRGPTRGDWVAVGFVVENADDALRDVCSTGLGQQNVEVDTDAQRLIDAEYIAAANPDRIRRVLESLARLTHVARQLELLVKRLEA